MRRTFIPLLQRETSRLLPSAAGGLWIFCKAIYTLLFRRYSRSCQPLTQSNYLWCQILYGTPHQSQRVSFITVLGYDKRRTETQKSFCLFFFVCGALFFFFFFFSGWISIRNNYRPKTRIDLGKLDPGCPHSKSRNIFFFFSCPSGNFSCAAHLSDAQQSSCNWCSHFICPRGCAWERPDAFFFFFKHHFFFQEKVHAACFSLSPRQTLMSIHSRRDKLASPHP